MRVDVEWKGAMEFTCDLPGGNTLAFSGDGHAASPMQALLSAIAACTAMDVIAILQKKRQNVTAYGLSVTGQRPPEGTWPRPFTRVTIEHRLVGHNLDPAAVARAIELSEQKYCSVAATLRQGPAIHNVWTVSSP